MIWWMWVLLYIVVAMIVSGVIYYLRYNEIHREASTGEAGELMALLFGSAFWPVWILFIPTFIVDAMKRRQRRRR